MTFEMKATGAGANEQAPPDLLRAMLGQMQAAIQAEFDRFMVAGPSGAHGRAARLAQREQEEALAHAGGQD